MSRNRKNKKSEDSGKKPATEKVERFFSTQAQLAVKTLGLLIAVRRKELKRTQADIAFRVGISRSTLQKIESGHPSCEIGLVFQAASMVGIDLFENSKETFAERSRFLHGHLRLLPKRIKPKKVIVDDDF